VSKNKQDWNKLSHEDRLKVLRDLSNDKVLLDYRLDEKSDDEFSELLSRQRKLWAAGSTMKAPVQKGRPPSKEVVLGAWRDLERSEALLELIDNSIDAWRQRYKRHPKETAKQLKINIDIDQDAGQLTYEDNAGGVSEDFLEHLVVPGYSQTDALADTIGSYKTGGKKAVFRLAEAVRITTRYWNPAETSDETLSIHLDESWLTSPDEYKFPVYQLAKGSSGIEKGQTQYVMQLRHEPVGQPWYKDPDQLKKLRGDIERTYSLLKLREPGVRIFFPNRGEELGGCLDEYYDLTSGKGPGTDIRPQRVDFEMELDYRGEKHRIVAELVIGCRITSGKESGSHGIDLYGNDRLFIQNDTELLREFFPTSSAGYLLRGYINIKGPNIFVPWDTHKRHLNLDRDIIEILRTHPIIRGVFDGWCKAYKAISGKEVKKLIQDRHHLAPPGRDNDVNVPHHASVKLEAYNNRQKLKKPIFVPSVGATKKPKTTFAIHFALSENETRTVASLYGITGSFEEKRTMTALSTAIKEDVLKKAERKSR